MKSTISNLQKLHTDSRGATEFIFSGGGSLGAVQVGMLRALVQEDIYPDFLIGSSVGALNTAHFALAPSPQGVIELADIWKKVKRSEVFPVNPVSGELTRLLSQFLSNMALCAAIVLTLLLIKFL